MMICACVFALLLSDTIGPVETPAVAPRPGGFVPPAPGDNLNSYHDRMNAWQAFEEKGIPLPPQYDPAVQQLKAEERWREEKAYRARRAWLEDHTAPPPRGVRRR